MERISSGGISINAALSNNAQEDVYSGGISIDATVSNTAVTYVYGGGGTTGTTLSSGGMQTILSGGTAMSTAITSGGIETVSSGGTVSNSVISAGGNETLLTGAIVSGFFDFSGGNGTLSIGGTLLPSNVISGFDSGTITSDDIILTSVSYASSDTATLGASNILTLDLSGTISTLNFDPLQNFTGDYFAVEANSQNQVVIIDPPLSDLTAPKMSFLYPATISSATIFNSAGLNGDELFTQLFDGKLLGGSFLPAALATHLTAEPNVFVDSSGQAASSSWVLLQSSLQHGAHVPGVVSPLKDGW